MRRLVWRLYCRARSCADDIYKACQRHVGSLGRNKIAFPLVTCASAKALARFALQLESDMRKTWTIGAVALLAGILMMPNYQAVARGGGGFHGGGFPGGFGGGGFRDGGFGGFRGGGFGSFHG